MAMVEMMKMMMRTKVMNEKLIYCKIAIVFTYNDSLLVRRFIASAKCSSPSRKRETLLWTNDGKIILMVAIYTGAGSKDCSCEDHYRDNIGYVLLGIVSGLIIETMCSWNV